MSDNLKETFDSIQGLFNRCINHAYITLVNGLSAKFSYLSFEQSEELEKQEYLRATDELTQLYMRNAAITDISNYFTSSDFFWDSNFYELLRADEKRKYLAFSVNSFNYSQYEQDTAAYDEELPYFSVVVKAVVLERYLAHLKMRKEDKPKEVVMPQEEPIKQEQTSDIIEVEKAAPPVATMENPFESVLNDEQMKYLAECINEVKMFNASVSADDLKAIFACKPNTILKSKNNRYVAYFFSGLGYRELITSNWQSVIGNNKLFISSQKDSFLNQSDLSSATNNVKEVDVKGKYAIIEKYLKQVKKL
ncbi:hypothetical protein [Parabacteroides sp.]